MHMEKRTWVCTQKEARVGKQQLRPGTEMLKAACSTFTVVTPNDPHEFSGLCAPASSCTLGLHGPASPAPAVSCTLGLTSCLPGSVAGCGLQCPRHSVCALPVHGLSQYLPWARAGAGAGGLAAHTHDNHAKQACGPCEGT